MAEANDPKEEFLKTDTGRHPVSGAVTNDSAKNVKMLRVHPETGRLLTETIVNSGSLIIEDPLTGDKVQISPEGNLQVSGNELRKIAGQGGFYVNKSAADRIGLVLESIVVMENAQFALFEINDIDMVIDKGLFGITIPAGIYLPTDPGVKITRYQLVSGAVIEYS